MDIIYKLTAPNGKLYIGRTHDFDKRMIGHKSCTFTKKLNFPLYKSIRKYGWDNFKKEIICEVDSSQSVQIEEEMIKLNDSVRKGLNVLYTGEGGDTWKGRRDTDEYMEFVEKMKTINKGKNNGMYGKLHKEKSKKIQKEKAKGRFSLEWFIERNGDTDGTRMYNERCEKLRNRKLNTDSKGRFIKKTT